MFFPVNINIIGIYHIGLLNKVTEVISQQLNVNIHKLNIESNDGIFEGRIQLFVHDVDDVKSITTNLRKIDEIKTVTRIEKFEDQPNYPIPISPQTTLIVHNDYPQLVFNPCNLW